MQPHISLIIPVHNAEPFLERCLNSAAAQTEPNLEIICIDDASSDASGAMLDARARTDDRFRVIHRQVNGGESAARNQGIAMAKGEYLAFLDHDDMLEPDACRLLYQTAKAANADIAKGRVQIHDYSSNILNPPSELHESIAKISKYHFIVHWWSAIYRTSSIKNKIYFDENYILGGDLLFLYEAVNRANKVACSDEIVYNYIRSKKSGDSQFLTTEKIFSSTEINLKIMQKINRSNFAAKDKKGYLFQSWNCLKRSIYSIPKCMNDKSRIRCCETIFKIMDLHIFPNDLKDEAQKQIPQLITLLFDEDRTHLSNMACKETYKLINMIGVLGKLRFLVGKRVH